MQSSRVEPSARTVWTRAMPVGGQLAVGRLAREQRGSSAAPAAGGPASRPTPRACASRSRRSLRNRAADRPSASWWSKARTRLNVPAPPSDLGADAQDGRLALVDQRVEGDHPLAREVGQGERPARERLDRQRVAEVGDDQVAHLGGDRGDPLAVGPADDRDLQAAAGVDGEADVDLVVIDGPRRRRGRR